MTMQTFDKEKPISRRVRALLAFLGLSLFMYASIMYKIIYYGP